RRCPRSPLGAARGAVARARGRAGSGDRVSARVVLLGASNLTLGFPMLVSELRAWLGSPVEILCAHGHGRSYGLASRVLFRELPGIVECGLWRALASAPARPTLALLTDVGNDIMYGRDVEEIAGWVETAL